MTPWRYTKVGQLLRLEWATTRKQQYLIITALTTAAIAVTAFIVAAIYGQLRF